MADVIVIGAGFAGLAAATELMRAGVDVAVFEARKRVGGRVWSQSLDAPDGSAYVIERGAEFVLAGYETLAMVAAQHGLSLADTGMSYYVREPRGIDGVDAAGLAQAGGAVARCARAARSARCARAARATGGGSVVDVVAAAGIPPPLAEAVLARVEISCALEAGRLAPSVLEHVASFEPLRSHRIAGGNQRLADALADTLGRDRIKLGTPVRALDRRGKRVRVVVDGAELEADGVVLALPLPVLRRLAIEPPLPRWKRDVLARVEIGQAAKLHLPLVAAAPPSAVMSVRDRFWCWTATEADEQLAPVLSCFAGSPHALQRLATADGPAAWIERVRNLRRDLDPVDSGALLTTWDDDPWALGAYRAEGLATVDEKQLEAPVENLHFAGEWAGGGLSGLMEGALRSGIRAAGEISQIRRAHPHDAIR